MSCRNNQDSATRNGKKGDRPHTSNCKSNCPGRKKQCPGANKCPFQDDSNGNPSVPRDDKCEETSDAQRNATGMKVNTCTASVGCPALSPLVIQAPTDSKSPKTDLRIELYIHQLPTSRKNSQDVPQTDERGSLDSRKRRTSKESKKIEITQSSEDIRQSEVEAQILFIREEETDKNDESRIRNNSDQKSGSSPVNLMDAEKIEVETSSTQEKPNEESIDNRSGVPKSPLPTENDPPEEERRNEVQLISDEKQEEINEAADNTSDNQSSIDLNDAMIEESIVVEKAAQLQSAPRRPSNYVDVPQSNDGSSLNAKNNKATDTEEDGTLNGWNIPVKDMVDVSTQIELA